VATQYFRVKNFARFQHYKDRNPPWIKLYFELLNNYEFSCLQDASKWHLCGIWLLATRHENRLPLNAEWVGRRIDATSPVDLSALISSGFLELCNADSTTLATCKQSAMPETETETETETEAERPPTEACGERPQAGDSPPGGTADATPERDRKRPRQDSRSNAEESPTAMTFPVKAVGKGKHAGRREWPLTEAKVAEYRDAFPDLDVPALLRFIRQWCIDTPAKRKTCDGMFCFLTRWMNREMGKPNSPYRRGGATGVTGRQRDGTDDRYSPGFEPAAPTDDVIRKALGLHNGEEIPA
jgi:hypothetical protein